MNGTDALWVIDPSVSHPEDQGVQETVGDWSGPVRVFQPVLRPGDGPDAETGYDTAAIVILGSAASVYEDRSWMRQLEGWLRPVLLGQIRRPLLGICYGHQLVAHLAGGRVGFLEQDRTKRVGVERTQLSGARLLPGKQDLEVVVSHRETVIHPPEDYRVVARRPGVECDGLEHATLPIHSFQFHPEAREAFAERAGIPLESISPRLREDSGKVLRAFRDSVGST